MDALQRTSQRCIGKGDGWNRGPTLCRWRTSLNALQVGASVAYHPPRVKTADGPQALLGVASSQGSQTPGGPGRGPGSLLRQRVASSRVEKESSGRIPIGGRVGVKRVEQGCAGGRGAGLRTRCPGDEQMGRGPGATRALRPPRAPVPYPPARTRWRPAAGGRPQRGPRVRMVRRLHQKAVAAPLCSTSGVAQRPATPEVR